GGGGEPLVLGRDLVGQQPGRGHVEPEPDGGAVAGVLLHRLEGERVVEQVGPVHQGDLLEPFPRVVVPVGEAVDDQGVADGLAQVEGLDGDPLGGHLVGLAVELDAGGELAEVLLERGRPVVLGPGQQAEQGGGSSWPRYGSNAFCQSSSVPSSRPIRWVVPMAPLPSDPQTNRGRWWASWARQDGQSWGAAWPHRAVSWRMPFSATRGAEGCGGARAP